MWNVRSRVFLLSANSPPNTAMGAVEGSPPRELIRQATKILVISNSNVSFSRLVEEVEKFAEMYDKWVKDKARARTT
jgi:hypothetical protein